MREHDYALVGGLTRVKVGRYLSVIAAGVSATIVFLLLAAVNLVQRLGLPANLTPSVLSLVGAGAVFGLLYWIFSSYAWRWPLLSAVVKVPNLAGDWRCEGKTVNADGTTQHIWEGTLTIYQSWDKIRAHLKTSQSRSNSIAAALVCDDADGYQLLYHYRNEPRIDEIELRSHSGFCDLNFSRDLQTADGEYFNGHGRNTFGTMKLTRA